MKEDFNKKGEKMSKRILVVEDEAITALDLKYSLEELGYEVIDTVDTGQDAIDTAAETVPDVVLMDICTEKIHRGW